VRFALVTLETEDSRRHVRQHRDEHNARLAEWMTKQAEAGKLIAGEAFETEHTGPVTIRRDGDRTVTVTARSRAVASAHHIRRATAGPQNDML
jgi:hypothetical protein